MDIPQHGCGTRPIIICAALRLRRDELHRTSGLRRAMQGGYSAQSSLASAVMMPRRGLRERSGAEPEQDAEHTEKHQEQGDGEHLE
jgi:hypothetical protein